MSKHLIFLRLTKNAMYFAVMLDTMYFSKKEKNVDRDILCLYQSNNDCRWSYKSFLLSGSVLNFTLTANQDLLVPISSIFIVFHIIDKSITFIISIYVVHGFGDLRSETYRDIRFLWCLCLL